MHSNALSSFEGLILIVRQGSDDGFIAAHISGVLANGDKRLGPGGDSPGALADF